MLAEFATQDTRSHAEVMAPAVLRLMQEQAITGADLGGILVGTGPGPFTGLRAGLVTARTLGFVWEIPVYGMCSLDALAHHVALAAAAAGHQTFAVATDARRKELYWATYQLTPVVDDASAPFGSGSPSTAASVGARRVDGPHVGGPDQVGQLPVYGQGASLYPEALAVAADGLTDVYPTAADLARAAHRLVSQGEELSQDTTPLYLRESDAKVPEQRKKALR